MTSHGFQHSAELCGPAGCTVEACLEISYSHQKADATVGAPEGFAIEHITVLVGPHRFSFDGDYSDAALLEACYQHFADERERIDCERADMQRDERGAQ